MKAFKNGRSRGSGRFVALHHFLLNSAAWRALTPYDRAVYIEVVKAYDGTNNGRIALGVRRIAAQANVGKNTAVRSLERLVELGFLEQAQAGAFDYKVRHATEWRLTQYRCDRTGALPSKAFMKWRPENTEAGPSGGYTTYPPKVPSAAISAEKVPSQGTVGGE
jgi:hypothetical protein